MNTITKVLMVDDDSDDQLLFKDAIREIAPTICCDVANNGIEALDHLENISPPPSIIFLDLNMPLMDGFECLATLKTMAGFSEIPVIIFTTSNHEKDIKRSLSMGAYQFITKPTDYNLLKIKLKEILENILQCIS